jgi:hypothetical protein
VLHDQKVVVILLKDGPDLDGSEGPPYYQVHGAAVQPAEDARAVPVIKTILNCCRWMLPLRALASISSGARSMLSVSGSKERAGVRIP